MSRRPVGNVRRTTKPPPSTVRSDGTTLATGRSSLIRALMPAGGGLFRGVPLLPGGERVHGAGEGVLPRPVPLEVSVSVAHGVGLPPVAVDRAGEHGGDDASRVVLGCLHAGGIGRGDGLAQLAEDRAELGLHGTLGLVVLDEVAV